jgi:hypothetical protein
MTINAFPLDMNITALLTQNYPLVTFFKNELTSYQVYTDVVHILKENNEMIMYLLAFTLFLFCFMKLEYQNVKLEQKLMNEKNENLKLQENLIIQNLNNEKLKNENKKLKNENKKLKEKITILEEQNYHRVDGVRRSLRVEQQREIIEEITDEEISDSDEEKTVKIKDSILEIFKLNPGKRFTYLQMFEEIKKYPNLKNATGKTPENSINYYLQKLFHKNILGRERYRCIKYYKR